MVNFIRRERILCLVGIINTITPYNTAPASEKQYNFSFDPFLGIIKKYNEEMMLSDGHLALTAEYNLELPRLEGRGSCNHLFQGAKAFGDLAPHISDSHHTNHKAELNHLGGVMQTKMLDDTQWLLRQIRSRLNIDESPYTPIGYDELDRRGPMICNDGKHRCTFKLGPAIHQSCIRTDKTPHPAGYFFPSRKYKAANVADQVVQTDPEWAQGMCGALSTVTEGNSTVVARQPSMCCSLAHPEKCPTEAVMALQAYYDKSKLSTAPAIRNDSRTYCISIESVSMIKEKPKEESNKEQSQKEESQEKPQEQPQNRKRRNVKQPAENDNESPVILQSMDVLHDNFYEEYGFIKIGRFYIGLSPLMSNVIGFIRSGWSRLAKLWDQYKLVKELRTATEQEVSFNDQTQAVVNILKQVDPTMRSWFEETLVELMGPSEELDIFLKELNSKLNKPVRNRRSISSVRDFFSYWSTLGPLTNEYNRESMIKIQDWQKQTYEQIARELAQSKNTIYHLGQKTSHAMDMLAHDMCNNKFSEWSQLLRTREMTYFNSLKTEITSITSDIASSRLPLIANIKALQRICKSQTVSSNYHYCDNVNELVQTKLLAVYMHQDTVVFKTQILMDLPSYETNLVPLEISSIPVPAQDIIVIGNHKANPDEITKAVKNIKEESSSSEDITINEIALKLSELLLEQKRAKRSVGHRAGDIKPYLMVDFNENNKIFVFHVKDKPWLYLVFDSCLKTKNGKIICHLGQHESWKSRLCIVSLLNSDENEIKRKCPLKMVNAPGCIVNKPYGMYIISTHEEVKITSEQTSRVSSIFNADLVGKSCNSTCLVEPKSNEQQFTCSSIKYKIPKIHKEIINTTIIINKDTNVQLNPRDFEYAGIKMGDMIHWNNQSFSLPEFRNQTVKTSILGITGVTTIILVTCILYKCLKCSCTPFCLVRKCIKRRRKPKTKREKSIVKEDSEVTPSITKSRTHLHVI